MKNTIIIVIYCILTFVVPEPLMAQDHYALTILSPRDDLPTTHRYKVAYPGLIWTARVAADGGEWPYTYELRNAPVGMSIESGPCNTIGLSCIAGTITWINPASNATPGIRVCDKDGDCTAWEDWTITVSVTPFRWIDQTNGNNSNNGILVADGGTGAIQSMAGLMAVDQSDSVVYFRGGNTAGTALTYTLAGVTTAGSGDSLRTEWEYDAGGGGNSTMWECYPNEFCIIDFRYPDIDPNPPAILKSDWVYVAGFKSRRDKWKSFECQTTTSNGDCTFKNITFTEGGISGESQNAAFIGTNSHSYSYLTFALIVQNVIFPSASHTSLKLYSLQHALIENSEFESGNSGMDVKSVISRYTIRANKFTSCSSSCISGNMDEQIAQAGIQTQGEVTHNYFNGCGVNGCIYYADQFPRSTGEGFGPLFAWRNTFNNGVIHARDVTVDEGNLSLTQNVLINSQAASGSCPAKILCTTVTDFTKIVLTNNLTGITADSIVDENGNLQGSYLTEHGPNSITPKGHMLQNVVISNNKGKGRMKMKGKEEFIN